MVNFVEKNNVLVNGRPVERIEKISQVIDVGIRGYFPIAVFHNSGQADDGNNVVFTAIIKIVLQVWGLSWSVLITTVAQPNPLLPN